MAGATDDTPLSAVLKGTSAATLANNRLTGVTVGQWRQSVTARMGGAANQQVLL